MSLVYSVFAATSTTKASANTWIMWALIAVMLVVFYFLLIRPQRRRGQEHEQMVSKLKKGEEVVTIGGMYGTIKRISDDSVVLEVSKGVNVTFSRSAIARALTVSEPEEEELSEDEEYDSEETEDDPTDELEEELEDEEYDEDYEEEEYEEEEPEEEPPEEEPEAGSDGGKKKK